MSLQINPYLSFNGDCEEAMTFYKSCLGGALEVMRFADSPMEDNVSADWKNKVIHARLLTQGQTLMGSDGMKAGDAVTYSGCTLSLGVRDPVEGQKLYNALLAGGKTTMPFAPTFWAKGFGMLVDKFGVAWMVNCE